MSSEQPSSALEREAQRVELHGNARLSIDETDGLWIVRSGRVEVFAIESQDGEAVGPRTHLFGVGSGEALFGLQAAIAGSRIRLLAVAREDSELLQIPQSSLARVSADAADAPAVVRWVSQWTATLSGGISPRDRPRKHEVLEPGTEAEIEETGLAARPLAGVAWVRHLSGSSHFLGAEDLPAVAADGFLPLTENTWLVSAGPAKLAVIDTAALLGDDLLWPSLATFHRLVVDRIEHRLDEAKVEQREQLHERSEFDRRTMREAVGTLAGVLLPAAKTIAARDPKDDTLMAACRVLGHAQGFEVHAPEASSEGKKQLDVVQNLAKASNLRVRSVMLKGKWWRQDHGHLLAFKIPTPESAQSRPVALLSLSPSKYELYDPEDDSRKVVSEEVAKGLLSAAHMFYPPFPNKSLTGRDLLNFGLRSCRGDIWMMASMGLAAALLALLTPLVTEQIFENVIPGSERPNLFQLALALVVAAIAAGLFEVTRGIAVLRLEGKVVGQLQSATWSRLMSLPVNFFRRFTVGDLAIRAMGIDFISETVTGQATSSILSAIFSVISLSLLFWYDWRLALVAIGVVAVFLLVSLWLTFAQLRHLREYTEIQGKIEGTTLQMIHSISKLKVAGAERRAFSQWGKSFADQRGKAIKARRIGNAFTSVRALFEVVPLMVIFSTVVWWDAVEIKTGAFLAFSSAFGQFLSATLSVTGVFGGLLAVVPVYKRMGPILESVPEVDEAKASPGAVTGDIEFTHVCFRYKEDGPLIVNDVSLKVDPGDFVALVGPSGSGKSTCLRLLIGFEQPESGSIFFDGQDLTSIDIQAVRRQLGVVLQSSGLMAGDIFQNIVGSSGLTIDDAWDAARMSGLDKDIEAMPMGMHTVVSEGAGTFSGGQRQRLLIARALVTRPRILLFDEATSALDNRTQAIVSQSLEQLDVTRIVIAHRLSTIINADRIYVLESGKVIQSGTYKELAGQPGLFSELVKRQVA